MYVADEKCLHNFSVKSISCGLLERKAVVEKIILI